MPIDRKRLQSHGRQRQPTALLAVASALLLLGCAGQVPPDIRSPTPAPLTVGEARAAPERHRGTPVRWGGSMLSVQNATETTDIEVLARPLDAIGEPRMDAAPQGRFIARFRGFLDPAEYPRERLLTVSGIVTGTETRDVRDYPYEYPVVTATGKHLWPKPEPVGPAPWYPDPWYGPGWGPWWGPGYGPWYRPWYW
jgi:outer membrane lipoprotein